MNIRFQPIPPTPLTPITDHIAFQSIIYSSSIKALAYDRGEKIKPFFFPMININKNYDTNEEILQRISIYEIRTLLSIQKIYTGSSTYECMPWI